MGTALSSRILYAVILIPLCALTLQRTSRSRTAALFFIVLLTAAVVTLPVFAPHPLPRLLHQLQQNSPKLRFIANTIHPQWTLPLLATSISCIAFFIRMNLARLFFLFSTATLVILLPFVLTFAHHTASGYAFFYLSVSTLSFSLWALSRYEHGHHAN